MILRRHCLSRNATTALDWTQKIKDEGWEPDLEACNSLFTHLSAEGKVDETLELKYHISTKD